MQVLQTPDCQPLLLTSKMNPNSNLLSILLAAVVAGSNVLAQTNIFQSCRFVCPDTIQQFVLLNETLGPDNTVENCSWGNNGIEVFHASFDSVC